MPSHKKKRRPAVPQTAAGEKQAGQPPGRAAVKRQQPILTERRQRLVLGGVLLVTALAFVNSLDGQFVYDDRLQVLKNPAITRLENIPKMFTQSVWQFLNEADKESAGPYYRPLFNIALTINYAMFGLEVVGWHLFSLLVHLVVTLLVYALGREWGLSREIATASALLFGVHPVHSESVAWVAALPDPLAAVFILSSLLLYERRRRRVRTYGRYRLAFSILFALMAMLTKEVAIVFPVFLLCRELLNRTPGDALGAIATRAITRAGPFLAVIPIYLALRYYVLGFIAQAEATAAGIPTMHVIATLPSILLSYARMLALPVPLAVMYDNTYVTSFAELRFWVPALVVVALLIGALWLTRNSLAARSSLLLLVLFLLPVLNLKAFRADESLLHDRYLYLPSIGFCLLAAMAIGGLAARFAAENNRALPAATAALALVLFVLTVSQNRHWQSEDAMTSHALEVAPEWPFLHNYIGAQYSLANRMTEAERAYQKALSINPRYYDSLSNLGDIYRQQNRLEEAVRVYTEAVESGAPYADTYFNLGVTYTRQGNLALAEQALKRAVELRPSHKSAQYNLGWVYDHQDKRPQAEEAYVNTLRIDPSYVEPRINLGVLLTKQGRYQEALEQLQSAQRLAPDNSFMMYALGDLYMRTRRYREAVDMLTRLSTREPSHRLVHTALGLCYENLGDKEQAKARFQRAIEVAPQDPYTNVAREHLAKM